MTLNRGNGSKVQLVARGVVACRRKIATGIDTGFFVLSFFSPLPPRYIDPKTTATGDDTQQQQCGVQQSAAATATKERPYGGENRWHVESLQQWPRHDVTTFPPHRFHVGQQSKNIGDAANEAARQWGWGQ